MTFTFGSLFAGIGGFDLGFHRAGMKCRWQVEIDPFRQKVLVKHWSHIAKYSDVRTCGKHNMEAVDLIAGGFPCQPFSEAGEQRGEQDDRNLWPEMRRVIAELRPRWVVAENVPGIRNLYLDTVLSDLESMDYAAGTLDLPAVAFGAPHIRHRLFVIAYANRSDQGRGQQSERKPYQRNAKPSWNGSQGRIEPNWGWWNLEPDVGRVADGLPSDLDKHRLAALGNAVVPQVAEWLGRRIMEVERTMQEGRP